MTTSELVMMACGATAVVMVLGAVFQKPRPADAGPEPVRRSSVSILAGFGFFSGLLAIVMVAISGLLAMSLSMTGMISLQHEVRGGLDLAARILLYASLLPTIGSVAFAIAARGVIAESKGSVFGRTLYRTGLLLALLSGAAVLDARIANPATWNALDHPVQTRAPVDRVYFGASSSTSSGQKGSVVEAVETGSPAEKAGLRKGDWIIGVDNDPLRPQETIYERLAAAYRPGSIVTLDVKRAEESFGLVLELGSSLRQFEPLRSLLEDQSLDDERLTVLKSAGLDRAFTAEELSRICKTFDFDEGRLKAIDQALPRLQDPQNAYLLLATMDFTDAKDKLSRRIEEARKKK
jgi:membrane-associated protease RseP (regulator of RpoE activity)